MIDGNFGNVSAGVLFSKVAYQRKTVVKLNKQMKHAPRKTNYDAHGLYEKTFQGHGFPSRRIPTNISCFSLLNISLFQAK